MVVEFKATNLHELTRLYVTALWSHRSDFVLPNDCRCDPSTMMKARVTSTFRTGMPSCEQAAEMITMYLTNSSHFGVQTGVHISCNDNSSAFGHDKLVAPLPSISRADPAFASQDYWRGMEQADCMHTTDP